MEDHLDVAVTAAATAVIDTRQRILLVKEAAPEDAGLWNIPSGRVEGDELIIDAARRELREEAGLDAVPQAYLGVYIGRLADRSLITRHVWFLAVSEGARPSLDPTQDISEWRFFARAEVAELSKHGLLRRSYIPDVFDLARKVHATFG